MWTDDLKVLVMSQYVAQQLHLKTGKFKRSLHVRTVICLWITGSQFIRHKTASCVDWLSNSEVRTGWDLIKMSSSHWRDIVKILLDCLGNASFHDDISIALKHKPAVKTYIKRKGHYLHKNNYLDSIIFVFPGFKSTHVSLRWNAERSFSKHRNTNYPRFLD